MTRRSWGMWIGAMSLTGSALLIAAATDKPKPKILFYSESDGFRHSVVVRPLTGELSHAEKIFKEIATRAGYDVYVSQSSHDLRSDQDFARFDAIVTYTSGNPKINREALFKYMRAGGAFVGIHASTDSFKDDPAYVKFIGAAFKTHGSGDQPAVIKIEDTDHPATRMLGEEWTLVDEFYHFDQFDKNNVHMLMSVDMAKTNLAPHKMAADGYYPLAWTRMEDKGRMFYTAMGHREDVWTNPKFQEHLLGGLAWAMEKPEAK